MARTDDNRPIVLITGAAGNLGAALAKAFGDRYRVVGLDVEKAETSFPLSEADLTSDESLKAALGKFRRRFGGRIASVIHLAAYFDFTGEEHPLYRKLNVEGTELLLRALRGFEVEQFVYSGTMLVHAPGKPGEVMDESQPIGPRWAYPKSKADAEAAIVAERGDIPTVLLHLAGVYDERTMVPTLAEQIARIYERDFQSYLYSGDPLAGQAMLHKDDMADAFRRTVDRRGKLPKETTILIGEPEAPGYDELQDRIGRLIHGEAEWTTLQVPKEVAKAGAWAQQQLEPVIPDRIDAGKAPFIRPFMVEMADDHYALDISKAKKLLGWEPKHRLLDELPGIIERLKADPLAWYEANKVTPPAWLKAAGASGENPEDVRSSFELQYARQHEQSRWSHFANMGLGTWLLTNSTLIGVTGAMAWSDRIAGILLIVTAALSLSPRLWLARWASAAIGFWVLAAPMLFWTPSAAAYLNGTLVGGLIIAFAVALTPEPGVSPAAATTGPETPPGWSYNPSAFTQRLPIVALALIGLYVSRYLAAYQLGHVDGVWEPFFAGSDATTNGTEEIITSDVSKAWPVSDAAVGAFTYMLEIVTGIIGTRARWRTMPWLVIVFGLMIVPLGVVSIFFIIIQPIVIGTWCTLCLIGAAAMLVQIPYSLDEIVATGQFLKRRHDAGQSLIRVLFVGDTDEGDTKRAGDEFAKPPLEVLRETVSGGVSMGWGLIIAAVIGAWLLFTRLTLGAEGGMANADHLIGSLILTIVAIAAAEVARTVRFLLMPLGVALVATPFVYGSSLLGTVASLVCAVALVVAAIPRGPTRGRYGKWERWIV